MSIGNQIHEIENALEELTKGIETGCIHPKDIEDELTSIKKSIEIIDTILRRHRIHRRSI